MAYNIPPQSSYLYQGNWTPEIDSLLLQTIAPLKVDSNWERTFIPTKFIHAVQAHIEEQIGCRFTWEALYERFEFMEQRYRTFVEVVDVEGTHWDVHANVVTAAEKVWKNIIQKDKFAAAYFHKGEPEFRRLAMLFGTDKLKKEHVKHVVVISDSSNEYNVMPNLLVQSKDFGGEEVTSPRGEKLMKLRRKLFDDDTEAMDVQSTNEKGKTKWELDSEAGISQRSKKKRNSQDGGFETK